jgi:hypothetical protein
VGKTASCRRSHSKGCRGRGPCTWSCYSRRVRRRHQTARVSACHIAAGGGSMLCEEEEVELRAKGGDASASGEGMTSLLRPIHSGRIISQATRAEHHTRSSCSGVWGCRRWSCWWGWWSGWSMRSRYLVESSGRGEGREPQGQATGSQSEGVADGLAHAMQGKRLRPGQRENLSEESTRNPGTGCLHGAGWGTDSMREDEGNGCRSWTRPPTRPTASL